MKWIKITLLSMMLLTISSSINAHYCTRYIVKQQSIIDRGCNFKSTKVAHFGGNKQLCLDALDSLVTYTYFCVKCNSIVLRAYHCSQCLFNKVNRTKPGATYADVSDCFPKGYKF